MKKLCLIFLVLLSSSAYAQNSRSDGVVQSRNGFPAPSASIAVCSPVAITAASEVVSTVTITSTLNPAQGSTVQIVGMTPTAYNGSYTVLTTSGTNFTYTNPTQGLGAGTVFGTALVSSTTPCSPLASLCASFTDTTCTSPNPVTADGLGNYSFYVKPGRYTAQFYGSGLTARLQPDQVLACDPFSSCSSPSLNNRIYIDGTKYPITQAGIQQALTDACTVGTGTGTEINLPAGATVTVSSITGSQFTSTCPVHMHATNMGSFWFVIGPGVPNTVPLFTIKPSAANQGFWEFDHFRVTSGGTLGGTAFFLDSTNGSVNSIRLHDLSVSGLDPAAWFLDMNSAGGANQYFQGHIWDNNTITGGIHLNGTSTEDAWLIDHNDFANAGGSGTHPCIDASTASGSAHIVAAFNNGSCDGGFFISHGTTQCKVIYNQIEQTVTSTEANSAIIDLIGDTYSIDGCEIVGNNINAHTFATRNIRLGTATNTSVYDNVIFLKSATGIGVDIVAASNNRPAFNEFSNFGGGNTKINNPGNATAFAVRGPDGSAAAPSLSFENAPGTGWLQNGANLLLCAVGGVDVCGYNANGALEGSAQGYQWTSTTDPVAAGADSGMWRLAAKTFALGSNTPGDKSGFLKNAQTLQVSGSNFTTSSATLVAVTGLTFTAPTSFASNWSFRCDLIYSQATAAAANLFGIITTQTAPTNLQVAGEVLTNNTGTQVDNNALITTATSTTVITATPSAFGAIGTNADMFNAHIYGTLEAPSNASPSQVAIAVATGNASDALTIYRGSSCWWY